MLLKPKGQQGRLVQSAGMGKVLPPPDCRMLLCFMGIEHGRN